MAFKFKKPISKIKKLVLKVILSEDEPGKERWIYVFTSGFSVLLDHR